METQKTGGAAFPRPETNMIEAQDGMTLRDYFAGQALIGLIDRKLGQKETAQIAYIVADAMIAERSK